MRRYSQTIQSTKLLVPFVAPFPILFRFPFPNSANPSTNDDTKHQANRDQTIYKRRCSPMQLTIPRHHQTCLLIPIHPISRARPIEQPGQALLPRIPRLHLDRAGHIVAHEAAVAADAVRRHSPLVEESLRPLPRQLSVLERALVATVSRVGLARPAGAEERPAEARYAEQQLRRVHVARQTVADCCVAARRVGARGEELGVVARGRRPGAGVVVAHEVDVVEVLGGEGEGDVLEGPFGAREGGGEDEERGGEVATDGGEEGDVVLALGGVGGVFPVNYIREMVN